MQTVLKEKSEKHYYWVDPPEHLNYWSNKTLKAFLVRNGFAIAYQTADFPMELFPLFGEDYISRPEVGRSAHVKRVTLEKMFNQTSNDDLKDRLYRSFIKLGVGRNVLMYCRHEVRVKKTR